MHAHKVTAPHWGPQQQLLGYQLAVDENLQLSVCKKLNLAYFCKKYKNKEKIIYALSSTTCC